MAERGAPLLEVRSLSRSFGGVSAVRNVSFTVGGGESVGLVGPNGAGKTTLFNCICGQVRPQGGSVLFDGRVVDGLPVHRRARLGIGRTFQRLEVFPELTVREHLLVAERARRGEARLWRDLLNLSAPTAEEERRVDDMLGLVGLAERADAPVSTLGLGTCRLVELGRALIGDPRLLMADEPSSGLDAYEAHELAVVLRSVQAERGMAIVLVEHDLGMVDEVVDRVVVMDVGEVIADGPFDEVMADPAVRRAYLGRSA